MYQELVQELIIGTDRITIDGSSTSTLALDGSDSSSSNRCYRQSLQRMI